MVDNMVQAVRESAHQAPLPVEGRQVEIVGVSDNQRLSARLYALLHDVTHVPFGHTLEDEVNIFPSHDAFQKGTEDQAALNRYRCLLGPDSEIGKIIIEEHGRTLFDRLENVFFGATDRLHAVDDGQDVFDEIVYYLVSDTVCADLLDYVQRDRYFAFVEMNLSFRFLTFMYVADVDTTYGKRRRLVVRLWKPKTGRARRDIMTDLGGLLEGRVHHCGANLFSSNEDHSWHHARSSGAGSQTRRTSYQRENARIVRRHPIRPARKPRTLAR